MSNLGIAQSQLTGGGSGGSGSTITFRGAWSATTAYSTNDVVTQLGSVYIAVQGNTGSNPYFDSTNTNWKLFTQGFNYAGTWSGSTNYNFFDVVTYNNSFYLSVVAGEQSNLGNNPQTDVPSTPNPRFSQSVTASGTTNPLPSPSITFTAGSLVLVVVIVGNGSTQFATSVTDGLGNTYTRLPNTQATNGSLFGGTTSEIWYAFNVIGGTTTVAAHATFGGFGDITVLEYKDMVTSALVIDQSTAATGAGLNTVTLPTTQQAKELIFVAFFEATSGSTPAGFTPRAGAGNIYDQFVTVVGSYTASTGSSGQYVASMASFVDQTPSSHWVLLDQGFKNQGTWGSGVTYQPYDVVSYQGSSYLGLTLNNVGNTPGSSPSFWQLLAGAGQVAPRQTFTFNMPSAPITNVSITSNVVTLAVVNNFTAQGEGTGQGQVNTIYITGLTGASFLNGQVLTIATINGTTITANFTHANYGPTADSGTATLSIPVNGVFWTTGATGSSISLAPTFEISRVQCGQATRIELYAGSTFRTADASRPATTQPTQFTQHGVILDLNLDGTIAPFTSWVLSPLAYGANDELDALPAANISAALTNIGGTPTTNGFSVTFTWTIEETGSGGSPLSDQYVLGVADATNLPASVGNPFAYYGPDNAPGTPGSLDDEFNAATLSGIWTSVNIGTSTVTLNGKSIATFFNPTHAADNYPMIVQPSPAATLSLSSVAASVGISAVYTGTITGGGGNAFAGTTFVVSGFTNGVNNGTFVCSASTTTTLTLTNSAAVSETHAATAVVSFEFTMKINGVAGSGPMNNYMGVGLVYRDSGTGKFVEYFYYFTGANTAHLSVINYTNPTTTAGNAFDTGWTPLYNAPLYLKWKDDGTNFVFSWSFDGNQYKQLFTNSRTAFLATPNQVGIIWSAGSNAGTDVYANVDWFRRTV